MIWIILSFILVALASACNAVMDTSVHHYSTSIFTKYNDKFWNGEISWRNKYIDGYSKLGRVKWYFGLNKPVQLTDAFHFFKMWMIIFLCSAVVCALYSTIKLEWYSYLGFLLAYGTTWNTVFSGFYDKILRKL